VRSRRPRGPPRPHRAMPLGAPAETRPRLPHRARPRPGVQVAAQLPGPRRPGRATATAGRSSPQAVGGFELPPGSMLARTRLNLAKIRRFRKIAKRQLAQRQSG
jgi:hypothetical protein